jgi:adenylate cyclase
LFLFTGFSPGLRTTLGFLSVLLVLAFSFILFRLSGIFFDPFFLVLSLLTAIVVREITAYAVSDKEKQFIRKAFSTYVSHDVVEEIISDPSRLQLGGSKRNMSAIFTDIQGFSSFSELLDPDHLVLLLNRYLTAMSDVILKEKGTIDKYIGDAIVAFFGAPVELPDHAKRACHSAVMVKRTEVELNKILLKESISPVPVVTRIGINSGMMVAGNMGTENKMNYTVMGNSVNLAARLEGVNKHYKTQIIASKATLDETGNFFLSRMLDMVRVVGIGEPVEIYEILETIEEATDMQKEIVLRFNSAKAIYIERNWEIAAAAFRKVLELGTSDGPAQVFLQRCETYIKNPPPETWDGVINLDTK